MEDPGLALQLRAIPYASSVIVNVAYRRDQVQHPLDGFGVVVPATEGRSILAVSFSSVKFPSRAPSGTVLLRVFIGGATQPGLFDLDDSSLGDLVAQEMAGLIGVHGDPLLLRIARHPRAMPQYILGHLDRVEAIRRKLTKYPRLFLTGIAFDGVGIPDCIHAAETNWPVRMQEEQAEHEAIVAALEARDTPGLTAALRKHIYRAKDSMLAALKASQAADPTSEPAAVLR